MKFNWELAGWPNFTCDSSRLREAVTGHSVV